MAATLRRLLALMQGFASFRASPDSVDLPGRTPSITGMTVFTMALPGPAKSTAESGRSAVAAGCRPGGRRPSWPCRPCLAFSCRPTRLLRSPQLETPAAARLQAGRGGDADAASPLQSCTLTTLADAPAANLSTKKQKKMERVTRTGGRTPWKWGSGAGGAGGGGWRVHGGRALLLPLPGLNRSLLWVSAPIGMNVYIFSLAAHVGNAG